MWHTEVEAILPAVDVVVARDGMAKLADRLTCSDEWELILVEVRSTAEADRAFTSPQHQSDEICPQSLGYTHSWLIVWIGTSSDRDSFKLRPELGVVLSPRSRPN